MNAVPVPFVGIMEDRSGFDLFAAQKQAKILVVDDSLSSAKLLEIQLGHAGYHVVLAHDGETAMQKVKTESPDLIILDVMMPDVDGFTICEQLKSDSETWLIPIILLTALNGIQDRIQGIKAGADDFLTKPFNREELLARVRSLLRLRSAYDALQMERNHLALLYSISQELNRHLALDEVLAQIVVRTREALNARMCSIVVLDEERANAQQIISREGQDSIVSSVAPRILEEGLGSWAMRNREAAIIKDASRDRRWLVLPGDVEAVGSAIVAPLEVGHQIIGFILLTHTPTHYFHEGHLAVLTSIAAQAAVTVRNARLYETEQRRRKELEALQVAGVAISSEMNREALIHLIVRQGILLLDVPAASLMLPDESMGALTMRGWQGLSERYARREQVPFRQILALLGKNQRSFQIEDLRGQPLGRSDLAVREGIVSQLGLALVASGQFLGLLNLYTQDHPRSFNPEEVRLAETFAQQAAIALANADLLARTREERGKLSAVLSGTTDAVLVVDDSGNLVLANPAASRAFGFSSVQAQGQPLAGKVPDELLAVFHRARANGESALAEIESDDGRILYVSAAPVSGVGQVAVVQDITPLKELEAMRLRAEQEERLRLRSVFERYMAPELVDRILAQEAGLLERRERREVVVLFTDLRGFTRLTATYPAHSVIEVLNELFTMLVDIIYRHEGTVFDLAGDEIMVGFGAPFEQEDAAERALRAAGEIQQVFTALRQRWMDEQGIEVGLGVGIDRGTVVMGSIGAPSQMSFGMVGDAVNTAHGLVELAEHGEILVTAAVVESLDGEMRGWSFEKRPPVRIKGKNLQVEIYRAWLDSSSDPRSV